MTQRRRKGAKPGNGRCSRCGSYFPLWRMTRQDIWPDQYTLHCERCWARLLRESAERDLPPRVLLREHYPEG